MSEMMTTTRSRYHFDPMKGTDLSRDVAWMSEDPFAGISKYLTPEWVAEPKINGCRIFLDIHADHTDVGSTTSLYNGQLPHLSNGGSQTFDGTVLDGELTFQGGMSSGITHSNAAKAVRDQHLCGWTHFHAFDVLRFKGQDTTDLPFSVRREMLLEVVADLDNEHVTAVPQTKATPRRIAKALADGYEGVMLKRRTGRVLPQGPRHRRSPDWLKVKRTMTGEFFITRMDQPGEGGNTGLVGSVHLAYWNPDNPEKPYVECASVGGGFSVPERKALTDLRSGGLRPSLIGAVVEIEAQERTRDGRLRHTRFLRFRPDKAADECGADQFTNFHLMH